MEQFHPIRRILLRVPCLYIHFFLLETCAYSIKMVGNLGFTAKPFDAPACVNAVLAPIGVDFKNQVGIWHLGDTLFPL